MGSFARALRRQRNRSRGGFPMAGGQIIHRRRRGLRGSLVVILAFVVLWPMSAAPAAGATVQNPVPGAAAPLLTEGRVLGQATPVWSLSRSPSKGTNYFSNLNGVSCVSPTSCKAVGTTDAKNVGEQTLIQSWNGSVWSTEPSPSGIFLNSVSCASTISCKAVGWLINGTTEQMQTLIESWNGRVWSLASSPNIGTGENQLNGVSCLSATSCKAVGYFVNSSFTEQTLIESWNGRVWSLSSSPNRIGTSDNQLNSVSCVSTTSCKAVGYLWKGSFGSGPEKTLIESWNGSTWSISSSPDNGPLNNQLNAVSCISATSCKAVGYFLNGSGVDKTLIQSWNGTEWSALQSSPNNGTGDDLLNSLSCVSITSCKAVGYFVNGSGVDKTLIQSWNGTEWSALQSSPNNGTGDNRLYGVSCASVASCKAVGFFGNGSEPTLIESYG